MSNLESSRAPYARHQALRPDRAALLQELDRFATEQLNILMPIDKCWLPSDLVPDLSAADWQDQLLAWRQEAEAIPDDVLITLVANMITEEALPSYHAWLANLEHGFDRSGCGDNGLGRWMRGWVAEEKRHGDALARYLYVTGRVDMRAVEITIQHLVRNGFDPGTDNDVVKGFIYTSFQERATCIAHGGVARAARAAGDRNLARICDMIAGDEARHERGYQRFVAHLFDLDPDLCMIALEDMLRASISMPSRLMSDGVDPDLYGLFSAITQRNGIYKTSDYARIMEHVVRIWKIETRVVHTDAAKAAQDYIGSLPARFLKLAERTEARLARVPSRPLSWIFGRSV